MSGMNWWGAGNSVGVPNSSAIVSRGVQQFIHARTRRPVRSWHASSLYFLCPRELALRAVLGDAQEKLRTDPRLESRMDYGTALHRWWQEEYLGPAGILIADWECDRCGEVVSGRMPEKAHECRTIRLVEGASAAVLLKPRDAAGAHWRVRETRARFSEPHWSRPISGKLDGLMEGEPPSGSASRRGVLELKSWSFLPVRDVPPEYVWQANIYMRILEVDWARILFFDPTCQFRNDSDPDLKMAVQEVVLRYDENVWKLAHARVEAAERIVAEMGAGKFAAAGAAFDWPTKTCPDKSCKAAQRCGFRDVCFDAVSMAQMRLRISEGRDPLTAYQGAAK